MLKDLSKFQDLNVPFTEGKGKAIQKQPAITLASIFVVTMTTSPMIKRVRDKSPQHLKWCLPFTVKCTFPKGTCNAYASTVGSKRYGLYCSGLEYGYMDLRVPRKAEQFPEQLSDC